jgi:hypothetical protein
MILDHWHGQGVGDTSFACRAEDEDFQKAGMSPGSVAIMQMRYSALQRLKAGHGS